MVFIDELLDMLRYEFTKNIYPYLLKKGDVFMNLPTQFDDQYENIIRRWNAKKNEN